MKNNEDFTSMIQDELYDYKEVVGEVCAQTELIAARIFYKQEKDKLNSNIKTYKWSD